MKRMELIMSKYHDLQGIVEMTDELKLEMITDVMKYIKMKKLKDGNYAPSRGTGFCDSKQYLYEALYTIQQILAEEQ